MTDYPLRRILVSLFTTLMLLSACEAPASKQTANPQTLTVFAAASLTEAFTEIGQGFEAGHPGVKVEFNFAGSQQLAQQLAQGAQADVFASANQGQMDAAVSAGLVEPGATTVFAHNRLVVIYPKDNPASISRLQDLAKPGLRLVLAAKEVPVGGYSLQFLEKASQSSDFEGNFEAKVLTNAVSYEENVRAVYSKVALGEADAGIVYATDIPKDDTRLARLAIPDELNIVATYPLAPLQDSPNPELAESFVNFVISPTGQAILAGYGFSLAQ
jgi:molybdate transport system substrate-binding protein